MSNSRATGVQVISKCSNAANVRAGWSSYRQIRNLALSSLSKQSENGVGEQSWECAAIVKCRMDDD